MPLLEMMSYMPLTGTYHLQEVPVKVYRTDLPNLKQGSLQLFNPMTRSAIASLADWKSA